MDLLTHNFNNYSVRVILIDDKEWFIAKDIATLLGYKETAKAIRTHCKRVEAFGTFSRVSILDTPQLDPQTRLILEPDVWRLIIKSKLPEAQKIEEWIMDEVLPSIRKTGSYSHSKPAEESKDFATTIEKVLQKSKVAFELIEFVTEKKEYQLFLLDRLLKDDSPLKLLNFDFSNSFFIPTELGKMVGKSAVEINRVLEFKGLQTKNSGIWTLTESGKEFGIEVNGQFPQLKWRIEAVL